MLHLPAFVGRQAGLLLEENLLGAGKALKERYTLTMGEALRKNEEGIFSEER